MDETNQHSHSDEEPSPRFMRICRIIIVTCVLILITEIGYGVWNRIQTQKELNEKLYIAFYTDEDDTYQVRSDWEAYRHYRSDYDYNSRIYYDRLSDGAKAVYHFYEYAFDHHYSHILIDVRLAPQDSDLKTILHYFMLDSAMIEQNLSRSEQLRSSELVYDDWWDYHVDVEFHHLYIPGFEREYFDKKMKALTVAQQVIDNMPSAMSDEETALYFYDYLGNHVVYKDAENDGSRHYLYEALCENNTNCDGYANAYSLLCHLAGIPCFEKVYWGEESGHTWNSIQLDNVWYNVDPTASPKITGDTWTAPLRFRFGYSDLRQKNTPEFKEALPPCDGELQPAALHFANAEDTTAHVKLWQVIKSSKQPILFSLDTADKPQIKALMQKICDTYQCSLSHVSYETSGGWFVYVIRSE